MSGENLKVLLVDDDEEDFLIIRAKLGKVEHTKYKVDWISNFEEALEIIWRNGYDIYIVDYHLGEHNGLDLLKQALENDCNTPIILLTGQGDRKIDMEAMKLGASDYLNKNEITPALLERAIRYAIEHNKIEDKLREMSLKDGLTGLSSRRHFDEVMETELRRARRDRHSLSLIMIDIDFFKPFNDNYGHLEGDECLKRVSSLIGNFVNRPGDLAARYGGEELAVILPKTDPQGAYRIAEEIRKCVQSLNIPHKGSKVIDCQTVTISAGTYSLVPDSDTTMSELIKQADKALYEAKTNGRNNVKKA